MHPRTQCLEGRVTLHSRRSRPKRNNDGDNDDDNDDDRFIFRSTSRRTPLVGARGSHGKGFLATVDETVLRMTADKGVQSLVYLRLRSPATHLGPLKLAPA